MRPQCFAETRAKKSKVADLSLARVCRAEDHLRRRAVCIEPQYPGRGGFGPERVIRKTYRECRRADGPEAIECAFDAINIRLAFGVS
jgi:hypothetical protein